MLSLTVSSLASNNQTAGESSAGQAASIEGEGIGRKVVPLVWFGLIMAMEMARMDGLLWESEGEVKWQTAGGSGLSLWTGRRCTICVA